jgi:hypothetical protein
MSLSSVLWPQRAFLVNAFEVAILNGMLSSWRRVGRQPQEPDFIADLVTVTMPDVYKILSNLLQASGIQSSMVAVFCHQSPKVRYQGMLGNNCELGDLLIAHVHIDAHGHVFRNSLLLQAKVSTHIPHILQRADDQLNLYELWPEFEYTSPARLTSQTRKVLPENSHAGGKYLLINSQYLHRHYHSLAQMFGWSSACVSMPDTDLYCHCDLSDELFGFLIRSTGRGFRSRADTGSSTGWSRVVWDLLEITARMTFNRKKAGYVNSSRSSVPPDDLDRLFFAHSTSTAVTGTISELLKQEDISALFSGDDPPKGDRDRTFNESEYNGGISTVLLETREQD